ncbi:hypothetical protein HYS48_02315 [Candidatus Woesearchaeota archaeon]|nr:hypothetical protein [Candidatus Woesearchaeota archaeon]
MEKETKFKNLVLLLGIFVVLSSLNAYLIYQDVQWYFWITGLATNDSNSALGEICINHPPTITSIEDDVANVGVQFSKLVQASDTDGDTLTFSDDTSLFDINSGSGLIEFTPVAGQGGTYTITITVKDDTTCVKNDDTDTFQLIVQGDLQLQPQEKNPTFPGPPRRFFVPALPIEMVVSAPTVRLEIVQILADGKRVFDLKQGIRLAEFSVKENAIVNWRIIVKNMGFADQTNVQVVLELPDTVRIISLNPPNYDLLQPNQEVSFTLQTQIIDQPFRMVVKAISDQDEDLELVPVTIKPTLEAPMLGFQIPWYIPAMIAIPLLFFLGYSILKNRQLIMGILQNLFTALLAFLLRRTYFIDEDMLRKLIKAKRLNKYLHLYVVPDVYARYHDAYKNLRTFALERADFAKVDEIQQKYKIPREVCMLMAMALKKAHPRIYTSVTEALPEKLKEEFKKIRFLDPLKKEREKPVKERVTGTELR